MKSKNNKLLVSIRMPVYNEEVFIKELLGSLFNQKYENLERIVTNNDATDMMLDIIRTCPT